MPHKKEINKHIQRNNKDMIMLLLKDENLHVKSEKISMRRLAIMDERRNY